MFKTSARQAFADSEEHGVEPGTGAGPVSGPVSDPMSRPVASDQGVISLVIAAREGTPRTWNFTVSDSSFPSWAWR
jgi:hypothetical protein